METQKSELQVMEETDKQKEETVTRGKSTYFKSTNYVLIFILLLE